MQAVTAEKVQYLAAEQEDSSVATADFAGEIAEKNKENLEACTKPHNYDEATSLRKLKAAVKEKVWEKTSDIYSPIFF